MKICNKLKSLDDSTPRVGLMTSGFIENTCLGEYESKAISRIPK